VSATALFWAVTIGTLLVVFAIVHVADPPWYVPLVLGVVLLIAEVTVLDQMLGLPPESEARMLSRPEATPVQQMPYWSLRSAVIALLTSGGGRLGKRTRDT